MRPRVRIDVASVTHMTKPEICGIHTRRVAWVTNLPRAQLRACVHPLPQGVGRVVAIDAAKLVDEIVSECNTEPVPWAADVSVRGVAGLIV